MKRNDGFFTMQNNLNFDPRGKQTWDHLKAIPLHIDIPQSNTIRYRSDAYFVTENMEL